MGFRLGTGHHRRLSGSDTVGQAGPSVPVDDDLTRAPAAEHPDVRQGIQRTFFPEEPISRGAYAGEIDRLFVQVFALVGEAIAGATHALLAGDREAAKQLVQRDELVDRLTRDIAEITQEQLLYCETSQAERRELVTVLRMLPDLERNGDLAEHIARRAARGLGAEMSARSRGLVERMGEVAATIWSATADAFAERSTTGAGTIDDLDDELDDLHVTLTAELVAGTMPLPVAIELAMVARFYERFGDHAVNLARRLAVLAGAPLEPSASGPD